MSARYPTDWMWARACEMMDEAERMHRQFFRLAAPARASAIWEPPVDIFEDEHEILILVALPGVPAHRIEVTTEAGELKVRGDRALPFAAARGTLRRLEIPYGYFERRIRLPDAPLAMATHELADGCLVLRLRKIALGETP
jgi:HSP20 family protein